jgi:hypothetical protein
VEPDFGFRHDTFHNPEIPQDFPGYRTIPPDPTESEMGMGTASVVMPNSYPGVSSKTISQTLTDPKPGRAVYGFTFGARSPNMHHGSFDVRTCPPNPGKGVDQFIGAATGIKHRAPEQDPPSYAAPGSAVKKVMDQPGEVRSFFNPPDHRRPPIRIVIERSTEAAAMLG